MASDNSTAKRVTYPLTFTHVAGDIVVRSRDFPELLTAGETLEEALRYAEDALLVMVETYREKNFALPAMRDAMADEQLVNVATEQP